MLAWPASEITFTLANPILPRTPIPLRPVVLATVSAGVDTTA